MLQISSFQKQMDKDNCSVVIFPITPSAGMICAYYLIDIDPRELSNKGYLLQLQPSTIHLLLVFTVLSSVLSLPANTLVYWQQ